MITINLIANENGNLRAERELTLEEQQLGIIGSKSTNDSITYYVRGEEQYLIYISTVNDKINELITIIDQRTQNNIFAGFIFDGKIFIMSVEAQINWSNMLNIPDILFPLPLMTKNDEEYLLALENKANFYYTCMQFKNNTLQQGVILKKELKTLTTFEELDTFKVNNNL